MNYHTIKLNDQEINFRLKSGHIKEIETKTGKSVLEALQSVSMINCLLMLKYMRRSEVSNFSDDDASNLYDELVDNGYSLQTIYTDIIFPTGVVSGLLTQSDLDAIKAEIAQATQKRVKNQ